MEESKQQFEVRDLREKDKFKVDDKFLNGYARFVGIYAVGVYSSLCRHANKQQKCWPSIKKMAEELSISRPTIIGAIKNLEFWQIIKKQRVGKECTNRYFLIDKRYWKRLSEVNVIDFSKVNKLDFKGKQRLLQRLMTFTSNSKDTQKKGYTKERNALNKFKTAKEIIKDNMTIKK